MARQTITIDAGRDADFVYTLKAKNGVVNTSFTDADTPSAVVWSGGDQSVLFAPSASWIDPTEGTILVSFAAADTSDMTPSKYSLRLTITRASDGKQVSPPDLWLVIRPSPGSASVPTAYVTIADLLPYASWVDDLQSEDDLAGLANHCGLARKWLEGAIQQRCNMASFMDPSLAGWYSGLTATRIGYSKVLQEYLDADKLMITPEVVEVSALRALGTYCQSKVGPGKDDTNYQRLARRFLRQADESLKMFKAYIDINGDGWWEYCFDFSVASFRTR